MRLKIFEHRIKCISEAAIGAIAAGIGAAGSIGSAGIAGARNMRIAKYSADFQREQVREQNEYNSPAAQMQRYLDAGLNPNLIYSGGEASAGNQSSIARYDKPDLPTPDLGPMLGRGFIDTLLAVRQANADIRLKEAQEANERERLFNIRSDRMARDIENAYAAEVTGFNPGILLSPEEAASIKNSSRLRKYNSEILSVESLNALRNAQEGLVKLNAREKDWIYKKVLPLQEKILSLQAEGLSYENIIKKIDAETEELVRVTGATNSAWKVASALFGSFFGDTGIGRFLERKWKKHYNGSGVR